MNSEYLVNSLNKSLEDSKESFAQERIQRRELERKVQSSEESLYLCESLVETLNETINSAQVNHTHKQIFNLLKCDGTFCTCIMQLTIKSKEAIIVSLEDQITEVNNARDQLARQLDESLLQNKQIQDEARLISLSEKVV